MEKIDPATVRGDPSERARRKVIMPPTYFFIALITTLVLHLLWPLADWIDPPVSYIGLAAVAIGFLIVITAARDFERGRTTIKPFEQSTTLITGGPYRFSRNPMYLGMVVTLFGVAVLLGTPAAFAPIPVLIRLLTQRFIRIEESMLMDMFGEDYAAYCRKVRRWI